MLSGLRQRLNTLWGSEQSLDLELDKLRAANPTPLFWLFGKTQSGKTSLIRALTGSEDAEIGSGFRPCTRHSREYPFPSPEAPSFTFLDTRGVDEPGYEPTEDLKAFDARAHLVLVTCRLTDFATGNLRRSLETIRAAKKERPIVLVLTCLHEAYPGREHPASILEAIPNGYEELGRLIQAQTETFASLVDRVIPVDFTRPEEGYAEPNFGLSSLRQSLLELLPEAHRESFRRTTASAEENDANRRRATPIIAGYTGLASATGAIPVPFVSLVLLPAVQARMIRSLAKLYGDPKRAEHFLELAGAVGWGVAARQLVRESAKVIPYIGAATGAALAGASTYALGRAYCAYAEAVRGGRIPTAEEVHQLSAEELAAAERAWNIPRGAAS